MPKNDAFPELDDAAMLRMLDRAREDYERGAILEAASEARAFAAKIAWFAKKYDMAAKS